MRSKAQARVVDKMTNGYEVWHVNHPELGRLFFIDLESNYKGPGPSWLRTSTANRLIAEGAIKPRSTDLGGRVIYSVTL